MSTHRHHSPRSDTEMILTDQQIETVEHVAGVVIRLRALKIAAEGRAARLTRAKE